MQTERLRKKKKATLAELAVGGGLMALFLPVIIFAVFWAVIAVVMSVVYMFLIQGNSPALGPVLMVYGALLAAMILVAYRFSARFLLLARRLVGLMRERRRIRLETVPPAQEIPDSEAFDWDAHDEAAASRLQREPHDPIWRRKRPGSDPFPD
ncbi:MAG: hypothetical protein K8J31_20670 [Anaerolineae bacterium]|nr:hypothetical protein [Anaerolineae bacterium]